MTVEELFGQMQKVPLFVGVYDAKHGNRSFMDGVLLVMEYIAQNVSKEVRDEFNSKFFENIEKSEQKHKDKLDTACAWSIARWGVK